MTERATGRDAARAPPLPAGSDPELHLILPFDVWGMAFLSGAGAVAVTLMGRPDDTISTAITTAAIMVVAAIDPHDAWRQPILRRVDTAVGVAVGVAASWIRLQLTRHMPNGNPSLPN